jgi:aminoglycoside 6'-N-acetyltransferase
MAQPGYQFRPMAADDLPLVRHWLEQPHVVEWWGNADEQFALLRDDLAEPAMEQFVVMIDNRPFGYVQSYDLSAWPNPDFGEHPVGTRAIDQFIGEPDLVGCGHGSACIRSFGDELLAGGTPRVITDPNPRNVRAIRAYKKAGFRKQRIVSTIEGPALLMVRTA